MHSQIYTCVTHNPLAVLSKSIPASNSTSKAFIHFRKLSAFVTMFFLSSHLLLVLIPLHHCNGEVVYVTPTIPPNPDCPDGLPCHTLKQYFSNNSLTQQSTNLSMIFLPGQHAGVCKRTELKSLSFNATGVGQVVTINCTTIVFSNAMKIYLQI